MSKVRDFILLYVNGQRHEVRGPEVFQNLSSYLRYSRGITGTKVVCAEGDCGACTVMVARAHTKPQAPAPPEYESLNSCIAPVFLLDNCSIVTVEGLGDSAGLSEIQDSMVRNFGGQCGFCTPGFVMSLANLYEHPQDVTPQKVKNHLTGNLCRCTGYTPIIQAALDVDPAKHRPLALRYPTNPLMKLVTESADKEVRIISEGQSLYAPISLGQACRYKAENPDTRIFSSATDLGVQINKGKIQMRKAMSLQLIPELFRCERVGQKVHIGAKVSLTSVQNFLGPLVPAFAEFLNIFASPQIKNVATLVGNLANASPIADTIPPLMTLDTQIILAGVGGTRTVPIDKFFLGYKKLDLRPDEIIQALEFQIPDLDRTRMGFYKTSQRRDLDISCINAGFSLEIENGQIKSARIAYGGVAPTTIRLAHIEKALVGRAFKKAELLHFARQISSSIQPISDVRGSAEFRREMAARLFEKFIIENSGAEA